MSRRMSLSLWIVWSLLFVASLRADPPQPVPAPVVTDAPVVIKGNGTELRAQGLTVTVPAWAPQIRIDAVIYQVDPVRLSKLADKSKSPVNEFLKVNGFSSAKNEKTRPVAVHAIRNETMSFDVHGQDVTMAFKRISAPTIVTLSGHEATMFSGGEFPIPVSNEAGVGVKVGWREFGTKLKINPLIEADGQILLDVRVEESQRGEETGVTFQGLAVPALRTRALSLVARVKSGQHLLFANGSSESDLTQFVQLTPRVLTPDEISKQLSAVNAVPYPLTRIVGSVVESNPTLAPPNSAIPATGNSFLSPPAKTPTAATVVRTPFVVEDKWPIAEIRVGQSVVIVPVFISKTCLAAEMGFVRAAIEGDNLFRIKSVEPLPNNAGRRVTLDMTRTDQGHDRKTVDRILDDLRSANSVCVLPASSLQMADLYDLRLLKNVFEQIPIELRPRPIELNVGETFLAVGVAGLMAQKMPPKTDIGPFTFNLIDDDAGGYWRVSAERAGIGQIVEVGLVNDVPGRARLTEYLIKTDTRELEFHLKRQFPTAKVKITSIGSSALLLQGTAASELDVRAIIEMAEQFTPRVINRINAGAAETATSAGPSRTITLANGIEVTQVPFTESGELVDKLGVNVWKANSSAHPLESPDSEPSGAKGTDKSARPPLRQPDVASNAPRDNQLRELLYEIRELREEVRQLRERLESKVDQPTTMIVPRPALTERDHDTLILATYPVADLLVPIETLDLVNPPTQEAFTKKGTFNCDAFAELIRSTVAPESWGGQNGGRLQFDERNLSLIVRQSGEAHQEIRDLLAQLRDLQDSQFSIDLRLIKVTPGQALEFPELVAAAEGKASPVARLLTNQQASRLSQATRDSEQVKVTQLPKVTILNGQVASVNTDSSPIDRALNLVMSGVISGDRRFVRFNLGANAEGASPLKNLITLNVPSGRSVLFNLSSPDQFDERHEVGVPILDKVPHTARLFKNVSASKKLKPGESLFLLATPRVIVQDEEEELLGIPQ